MTKNTSKVLIALRVPVELDNTLRKLSEEKGMSKTDFVIAILENRLNELFEQQNEKEEKSNLEIKAMLQEIMRNQLENKAKLIRFLGE